MNLNGNQTTKTVIKVVEKKRQHAIKEKKMRIGTSLYIESFNKIKIPFYSGSFSSSFSSFNRDYIRSIPFFACIYYEHNYNLFCQVFWYKTANIYRATFVLSISYVIYKMYIWLEQGDFVHTITWIHIYLYIIWLTTSQLSGGNEGGGVTVLSNIFNIHVNLENRLSKLKISNSN